MFERFTETARRTLFFARYEASSFGSAHIESEHLLLGLLREDKAFASRVPVQQIRKLIEQRAAPRERISTSMDLPLSEEVKSALTYAEKESQALHHKHIDCAHLVLGLLRVENCLAAELLGRHGIHYETFRALVSRGSILRVKKAPGSEPESPDDSLDCVADAIAREDTAAKPIAPSLIAVAASLEFLVGAAAPQLEALSDTDAAKPLAKKSWSRKEALGHLVDWTAAHHHWFARALEGPKLAAPEYPQDRWVALQHYESFPWQDLSQLWVSSNRLVIHVLDNIPEEKLNTPCRIGINEPIPLSQLIADYVEHCEDIVAQILTLG